MLTMTKGWQHEIAFVNDHTSDRADILNKKIKTGDRILWLDYSVSLDQNSILKIFEVNDTLVFPSVIPKVDWGVFKAKTLSGSTEPANQMGLDFDTEVLKASKDDNTLWTISKTEPKVFCLDSKAVLKCLKNKGTKLSGENSKTFEILLNRKLKMYAYVEAEVILTATYECLGNIINAAGVVAK